MMAEKANPTADIIPRLREAASNPEALTKEELSALLAEAAEIVETLRLLVGIRQEVELEDAEPMGRA